MFIKKFSVTVFISLFVISTGCLSGGTHFALTGKDNEKLNRGSIIVINAKTEQMDSLLMNRTAAYLSKEKIFNVLDSSELPLKFFKEGLISGYYDDPQNLKEDTSAKLDELHESMNSGYVLLVWQENFDFGTTGIFCDVYAQLVKFPEKKIAGYSSFSVSREIIYSGSGIKDSINEMIGTAAELIVKEIHNNTIKTNE